MSTSLPAYEIRLAVDRELHDAIAIDEAAAQLYADAGLAIELADDHPFVVAERRRWQRALANAELFLAWAENEAMGFYALGRAGGRAYLEQLSVRPKYGRRGLGASLLEAACDYFRTRKYTELWLTTYGHLPWNRPFYERRGFHVAADTQCNQALRELLAEQRHALPDPAQRIAMVRRL
jgi:GNAT superfamily N-acetyltransferase